MTAYLRPFLCITFSLFFTSSLSSQRLVTINKDVITTTEFQQYINLQKASAGKKNADIRDLLGNEDEINDLLEKYIDQRIILTEAAKKGYNSKNKAINEIFNEQKDMLVAQLFLADKKEFSDISVSEDEISAFYEKVKKDPSIKYQQLAPQAKQQLHQEVLSQKYEGLKAAYIKASEKNFKIRRNQIEDFFVAYVNESKIKQTEVSEKLNEQLVLVHNTTAEQVKLRSPADYKMLMEKVREELIFNTIVNLEAAAAKFENSIVVKNALPLLMNSIIADYYIREEIVKISIPTDEEINEDYKKNKAMYDKEDPDRVERFITQKLQEEKTQRNLRKMLRYSRNEAVIKIYDTELQKIK